MAGDLASLDGHLPAIASKESLNPLWLRFAPVQAYFGADARGTGSKAPKRGPKRVQVEGRLRGDDASMRAIGALAFAYAALPLLMAMVSGPTPACAEAK